MIGHFLLVSAALFNDLLSQIFADLPVVVIEAECFLLSNFFVIFQTCFFQLLFFVVVYLHREVDWNVLAKAMLCFDTALNAFKGAPLPTCSSFIHHFQKHLLVDDFDDWAWDVLIMWVPSVSPLSQAMIRVRRAMSLSKVHSAIKSGHHGVLVCSQVVSISGLPMLRHCEWQCLRIYLKAKDSQVQNACFLCFLCGLARRGLLTNAGDSCLADGWASACEGLPGLVHCLVICGRAVSLQDLSWSLPGGLRELAWSSWVVWTTNFGCESTTYELS